MIKKILCLSLFYSFSIFAAQINFTCHPALQPMMERIEKVPGIQRLLQDIVQEGPLHVSVLSSNLTDQFGAAWDRDRRTIFVNISQEFGRVIGSILFEMQNAKTNGRFDQIEQLAATGQIDKNGFVESMERVEYENSLRAASLAEKGIQLGLFPSNARLPTYSSFQEHFHYQKLGGHSAWFAQSYDEIVNHQFL